MSYHSVATISIQTVVLMKNLLDNLLINGGAIWLSKIKFGW